MNVLGEPETMGLVVGELLHPGELYTCLSIYDNDEKENVLVILDITNVKIDEAFYYTSLQMV
jgi:hypothetical protein